MKRERESMNEKKKIKNWIVAEVNNKKKIQVELLGMTACLAVTAVYHLLLHFVSIETDNIIIIT